MNTAKLKTLNPGRDGEVQGARTLNDCTVRFTFWQVFSVAVLQQKWDKQTNHTSSFDACLSGYLSRRGADNPRI